MFTFYLELLLILVQETPNRVTEGSRGTSEETQVLPVKRKLYLWNKADFTSINRLVTEFANSFLDNTINTPVQDLWDAYKSMCMNCLQLVPTKTAPSGKSNQPWATPLIRRLSSKKKRLYN